MIWKYSVTKLSRYFPQYMSFIGSTIFTQTYFQRNNQFWAPLWPEPDQIKTKEKLKLENLALRVNIPFAFDIDLIASTIYI